MLSCHCNSLELQENAWHRDTAVERSYGHRPKPLCPPHLIALQYYSLLRFVIQKLAWLPVPCNCVLKLYIISWLCQNLSNLVLNVLVLLADATQLGKTVPCIHHPISTRLIRRWDSERELLCSAPWKLPEFAEITQNNGHYAVQGHSRSPILVPVESS